MAAIDSSGSRWGYVFAGISGICLLSWFFIISQLMIADVWDETNFLVGLHTAPFKDMSLAHKLYFVWSNSISVYRPIPTSLIVLGDWLGMGFVGLRYVNALFVCLSVLTLSFVLFKYYRLPRYVPLVFQFLALFSAGSIICSTWFANMFDGVCLFAISVAFLLLNARKFVLAGLFLGLAFFCKETAVLGGAFVLLFLMQEKELRSQVFWRTAMPAAIIGGVYFLLRGSLIKMGSGGDVHGFEPAVYFNSTLAFLQGFWWQNNKFENNGLLAYGGIAVLVLSIALLQAREAFVALCVIGISSVIYWGMFGYQGQVVADYLNFVGRLYLIPCIIFLFLLCSQNRKLGMAVVGVPLVCGGYLVYSDHSKFQRLYESIYARAAEGRDAKPLLIHYPDKPLNDPRRNILIGNYADAHLYIDKRKAEVAARD